MGTWCWQLSRILRRMVKIPRIRTLKSRRYRRMEAQDGRDGRRTRFVFVLRSVYHCSDELLRVTNRLCLPSRRLLGCARHSLRQFEPHQFCCDAQHCAHNERAKLSDDHVMHVVSTCQLAERFEKKTPCAERGICTPRVHLTPCTASPHAQDMRKTPTRAEDSGRSPVVVAPFFPTTGSCWETSAAGFAVCEGVVCGGKRKEGHAAISRPSADESSPCTRPTSTKP
jgi:hypothetical protein